MIDLLLKHGADIDAVSRWWASGIGVVEGMTPVIGAQLVSRGAVATPHAAAAMGLGGTLIEMTA
tara:strand:+ start:418 stop:609 length:192 start_codon:yes stop_codon:yes gene_type:complete